MITEYLKSDPQEENRITNNKIFTMLDMVISFPFSIIRNEFTYLSISTFIDRLILRLL